MSLDTGQDQPDFRGDNHRSAMRYSRATQEATTLVLSARSATRRGSRTDALHSFQRCPR